jgi:AcrR family transcriptional regulator
MRQIDRGMMTNHQKQMKISQLCKESGFKKSTIHYYLKIGLLDPPHKIGLNLFVYDDTHLAQLQQIRELREQKNLPLSTIKKILLQSEAAPENFSATISDLQLTHQKKEQILTAATELFSKKGYDKTTISDIVDALSMGRGTFYQYFEDKRELFIECIDRLTMVIVPHEAWDSIRNEKDPLRRAFVRLVAFQKAFPGFCGIINLLRQAIAGDDPVLAQKATEAFNSLIQPLVKDIRFGINSGIYREMDVEMASYFALASSEMLGFRLMMNDDYTLEDGMEKWFDFFSNAVLARAISDADKDARYHLEGELIDTKGKVAQLQGIRFNETNNLIGQMGKAEIKLELSKIGSFKIKPKGAVCQVEVTLRDGQSETLEVEGDIKVSGKAPFGEFTIDLKSISSIIFS